MTSIAFTGDIAFSRYFKDRWQQDFLDPKITEFLRQSDHVVANVECPMTDSVVTSKMEITHFSDPSAGGFLPKPVEQEQLFQALLREYENRFLKTFLPVGEENVRLDMIRYLEIAGKKVAVHLENGEALYINGKLDDIAQKLLNGTGNNLFVRCHQSYLVNLRHVESMQRYLLIFADGEELPVSKAYTKEVQQAFLEYEN